MRKIILGLLILGCFSFAAYAEGKYEENFNSYNYSAVYNSEDLTVSLEGFPNATLSATMSYIVNGPGGIVYSDADSYTANAAENLFCYTKTGEGTAKPVFGGLNNGWRGYYSNPPTSLDNKGGASAEPNQYNRRVAVVGLAGEPVLKMNPAKNAYISTYSVYADDDMEFYENTKWVTDVYVENIGTEGVFNISLTKGSINEITPLTAVSSVENGREIVSDVVKFGETSVYCFDEEAFVYDKAKWYTVEVVLKSAETDSVCSVAIKDRESGSILYSKENVSLSAKVNEDIEGVGYSAFTLRNADATVVYLDNILIEQVEFFATLATSRDVAINGRGNVAIKFNSEYVEESVNADNIKVYCGNTQVEGCGVSVLSQNRVKIDLPVLSPATEYKVCVNGVVGENGVTAVCEVPFKTVPLTSLSNASISDTNLSFRIKNNSTAGIDTYVVAVCENADNMIEGLYYIKMPAASEETVSKQFEQIVSEETANVYLYVIEDIVSGITPLSDFLKISK